ncbi:Ankyrin repeat domain-containing protein [Thalictrum thalictroides]|uniref:Ankyrin repeat domain-containing protein n=1 Tax=Thalictrum thalictroides TaxID=46969 RepID=A0A7J6WU07_THATH|nr:Ankyrin repeat domain-containing protein [Thalictrum thalictroides]
MERLVELSEQEVQIDFQLNCKCRANVHLRSLSTTTPIAFKVQTSSPNKFLVNPPNGLIPPLSYATFQIILKPQTQLPSSFPRSPSDRFLIKTAKFHSSSESVYIIQSETINSWFNSEAQLVTYDLKLKVAYVGVFLLRHAITLSDTDAVKNIIKRQKSIVTDLSSDDSESLVRLATESSNSGKLIELLSQAGLKTNNARQKLDNGDVVEESKWVFKGWTDLHVAAAFNRMDEVSSWIKEVCEKGGSLDHRDRDGQTALHVAANKGNVECVKMLIEGGADKNAKCNDGWTALYTAAANGNCQIVELLMELGADPMISTEDGRTAVDIAQDKGHKEVVKILEQGDMVLTTARRGEVNNLKQLLQRGANPNYKDQYGLTALHASAIKGHKDIVSMLIESGMDLECHDKENHTALHLAVEGGNFETVELLVNKGANINAMSMKGATPTYMAKAMGYDNISHFLLNRGASSSSSLS